MTRDRSLLFGSWPLYSTRHPWTILGGMLLFLAVLAIVYLLARGQYVDSFSIPGTESQSLRNLLQERFPQQSGDSATVVFRAPAGLDDSAARAKVEVLLADLRALPEVAAVSSPFDSPGAISPDRSTGRVTVQYSKDAFGLGRSETRPLLDLVQWHSTPELQVEAGGQVVQVAERELPGRSELIGLAAAVVILLVAFGSVGAMGLPVVTALLALTLTFLVAGVAASFLDMPTFSPQLAAMIGIGAGIDYALLIVTRFREELSRGLPMDDAIATAMATAGRSVLFAGSTVVVALLGLWAVGVPLLAAAATAAALAVALSVAVSLLVLPAILKLVGNRINGWAIPFLSSTTPDMSESGFAYRLSRAIQRRPVIYLLSSLAVLLAMAVPALDLDLGVSDAGNRPASSTARRAYDLISGAFGPGFNGPVLVGIRLDSAASSDELPAMLLSLKAVDGVSAVSGPIFNDSHSAALLTVIPTTAPQSRSTEELVHRLRMVLHDKARPSGADAFVGGPTAAFIDSGDKIAARMPVFFAAVIGVSFVLLMAVFRSLFVPLKAAVMNLLSIGAAYGGLVAVFQWGWLGGLLGVRAGPIESVMPIMLFAVLFGLSMDYEVFLISRIREEFRMTGRNAESVASGLAVTTRVISAAAAIMVAVFVSFALSEQRMIKEFGIGLSTAILVDATLVRLVLVPSVMQLAGRANWRFPGWLDRLLPRITTAR